MEKKRVFVLPGELAVTRQPTIISTLLGSCVSICLYNKKTGTAGMNHFMLPTGERGDEMKNKYGDIAIQKLVEMMKKLGSNTFDLEAHIYGGGNVVGHLSAGEGVGKRNIAMADKMMANYNIKVRTRKVGGDNGRKLFFDTSTGTIEERLIERSESAQSLADKKKSLAGRKIRVLVVDDSATIRQIITTAILTDPQIEVVGEAEDPYHAREKILELDPDVITLDIIMPKMDGITFLKKLMLHMPKPVIIVSSIAQKGSKQRGRAEEIGAFDVLDKEELNLYKGIETTAKILVPKIKMAAQALVKKKSHGEISHI